MVGSDPQDASTVSERFVETLVPQPAAWVTTRGSDGEAHLTPFVFAGVVSFDPPAIALSTAGAGFAAGGADGTVQFDSSAATSDIHTTEEFVVNFPTDSTTGEIHSAIQRHGQSSDLLKTSSIEQKPARRVTPPRLAGTIISFECRLRDNITFGDSALLVGTVVGADVHGAATNEQSITIEKLFHKGHAE